MKSDDVRDIKVGDWISIDGQKCEVNYINEDRTWQVVTNIETGEEIEIEGSLIFLDLW